jgi:hypothetical protein
MQRFDLVVTARLCRGEPTSRLDLSGLAAWTVPDCTGEMMSEQAQGRSAGGPLRYVRYTGTDSTTTESRRERGNPMSYAVDSPAFGIAGGLTRFD